MRVFADFDGFWWVRTSRELAGPYADEEEARADFECDGHPAEDCGPRHEGAAIGTTIYCDGSCRG